MSVKDTFSSAWDVLPVTLSSGGSISSLINLGGMRLFGIVMPSDWTTANLTFQMSPDAGTTWINMNDQSGNEILAVAEAAAYIALNDPTPFASLQYLRIRSGISQLPVVQTADRVLKLMLRSI